MELLKGKMISDRIGASDIVKGACGAVLAIVRAGENPAAASYERNAAKKLESFGLQTAFHVFPQDIGSEEFDAEFTKINDDPQVDGILVMQPLPPQLKLCRVEEKIDPGKDVDCISPVNIAKLMKGDSTGFSPCTAEAVIRLLKGYGTELAGKNVTLIGRSMVVGKPLALLLLKENATVTICHSRTENLRDKCKNADIIITAVGHPGLIDKSCIHDGQVLVDVGTSVGADGKLHGDINTEGFEDFDVKVTPVPGGIGAVTTAVLAEHVAIASGK